MRAALLEGGASRHHRTWIISSHRGQLWSVPCSPSGPPVAPGEGQRPDSCWEGAQAWQGSFSLGPPSLGLGMVRDTEHGMAPRWPHWDEIATKCIPAASGQVLSKVTPGDPGFFSSPPAWSWSRPWLLGWVGSRPPARLRALPQLASASAPLSMSTRSHFWAFAPGVLSPWDAFPWSVLLENSSSQLPKLPSLRRCGPNRCVWLPNSSSLGVTKQVVGGGPCRGLGTGAGKWRPAL